MLPSADHFASSLGHLGITQDDTIVIYGQSGMIMGPARAWWMLRAFGHEKIMLLNGGLPAWKKARLPLNTEQPPTPKPLDYSATYNPALVNNKDDMLKAIESEVGAQILDARPAGRFSGADKEPRAGMHSGHIPNSVNLPCIDLINSANGKMKSTDELRALFSDLKIDLSAPIITTCGSGITACALAFALHLLGHEDASIYDGSWSEWGQESLDLPVETKCLKPP